MFEALPKGCVRAIAADCPWKFKSYTELDAANFKTRRDAAKHYSVMTTEQIAAMPVRELAHKDGCHLFLWVPGPHLAIGLEVMEAWGWRYSSIAFAWVKLKRQNDKLVDKLRRRHGLLTEDDFHFGMGHTTRHNVELVLLGRRGNPKRKRKDVRELVLAPVREHSRKPDEVYRRIEQYCRGPYLELFARERRPRWIAWGNELEKFPEAAE